MLPEIVRLFGKIPIHSYGLMIVIGFLLQLWIGRRETLRKGLPDVFSDLAIVVLITGIIGGRVFYYIQFYDERYASESFLEIFKIWKGGLVFYGGAIGGVIGGLAFLKWRRLPILDFLDVVSLVAPIGMAFGRLGCFLNGCCYGGRCATDFALGVSFPPGSPPAFHHEDLGLVAPGSESLPVHPVQLYQAGHDFLLFFLMWLFFRKAAPPRGAGLPLLFVLYAIGRFLMEEIRTDNLPVLLGLTISQVVSVVLGSLFALWLARLYWRALRPRAPLVA